MSELFDAIIVGAGPAGLACAIEAVKRGLRPCVIEAGCVVNSIYRYPVNMTFFTTAELLEIGEVPMIVSSEKPKRLDGLKYYRRVTDIFGLSIKDYERVLSVAGKNGNFSVLTRDRWGTEHLYHSKKVIVAIGYYDHPNLLDIPGENLAKVSHYYTEPHPYFRKRVAVIGGKNSATETALELYRNSVKVTLIHRGKSMGREVKYWVLPDLNNRLQRGEIEAFFSSRIREIHQEEILIETPQGEKRLKNDFVLAMTGYHPDIEFLEAIGIEVDPETFIPTHDPETLESNVKGIYVAGALVSGKMTNRIFIENGRFHGRQLFNHLDKE